MPSPESRSILKIQTWVLTALPMPSPVTSLGAPLHQTLQPPHQPPRPHNVLQGNTSQQVAPSFQGGETRSAEMWPCGACSSLLEVTSVRAIPTQDSSLLSPAPSQLLPWGGRFVNTNCVYQIAKVQSQKTWAQAQLSCLWTVLIMHTVNSWKPRVPCLYE